jgi:hypothetical protein
MARSLDAARVAQTTEALCRRVETRFPGSGLSGVCRDLDEVARRNGEISTGIARPILPLRVGVGLLVVLILAGIGVTAFSLRPVVGPLSFSELVQTLEAGVNDIVFVVVAIFFLVTIESRVKRRRALQAIQELRSIAHVIDMHQLTKDPEMAVRRGPETGVLPTRSLTRFELSRYLDYCSEALSLTGKVAALYLQVIDDPVALQAVNEVEDLTTGLSRKIWQKLMILYAMGPEA